MPAPRQNLFPNSITSGSRVLSTAIMALAIMILATVTSGCGGGSSSSSGNQADEDPPITISTDNEINATVMLNLVNEERADEGLSPLIWNDELTTAALRHSTDMHDNNHFSHTGTDGSRFTDRIGDAGYSYRRASENIAFGYRDEAAVMIGWMNSPGHRANILDANVSELGAARVGTYWTQNFGQPRSSGSSQPTPTDQATTHIPASDG